MYHSSSCECGNDALDFFHVPPTLTLLEEGQWIQHHPLAISQGMTPIEFNLKGQAEEYLDLSQTYLYLKVKVTKEDGSPLEATTKTGPVNNFLHSLFSEIDTSLNGRMISSGTDTYPYRAYLENLLCYGKGAKQDQLFAACLWAKDTAGKFGTTDPTLDATNQLYNAGFNARTDRIKESKSVVMYDRLHLDLFQQPKYLINGVDLRLRLNRTRPEFSLLGTDSGKIVIQDVALFVRKVKPSAAISNKIEQALTQNTIKYPLHRTVVKTFTVDAGTRSKTIDHLFMGQQPTRVILGMVNNSALNGDIGRNPFHFQHFKLTKLDASINGQSICSKPFEPDFVNLDFTRSYLSIFQGMGKMADDYTPDISLNDYGNGYALWMLDFTASQDGWEPDKFHLIKTGNMRVELQFKEALPNTINVVVYAEFDNILEINRQREVAVDF